MEKPKTNDRTKKRIKKLLLSSVFRLPLFVWFLTAFPEMMCLAAPVFFIFLHHPFFSVIFCFGVLEPAPKKG
jgi:hypothetical protein